jgi:phage-related protein
MPTVGPGVYEIRIRTRLEHRVFCIAKFTEGIYVLHAFQKKTRKTPDAELELGRRRLKQVIRERSGYKEK